MWPVTARFLEATRTSHQVVVRADLYVEGVRIAQLQPLDGSVSVDSRRTVRRTITTSFADPDGTLAPGQGGRSGLLTPFGSELWAYRGIRFADGTEELVPLGVFIITGVTVSDGDTPGKVDVTGSDRSVLISRDKLLDPYQIAVDTPLETAIAGLLRDRWADVPIDFPVTGRTTGSVVVDAKAESDVWNVCRDLAESVGYDLAFDADGVARLRQVPDPLDEDPVAVYQDGADAVLLSLTRTFDSSRTYNGVVVSSESSQNATPFRAIAWDDNPDSPTYRLGPYGEVPLFFRSSLVTDPEQGTLLAVTLLRKILGRPEAVEWTQIVNPAHDALDVIRIRRNDLDYVVLLDRLDIPLDPAGSMSAGARSQEVDGG